MSKRSPAALCGVLCVLAIPTLAWRDLWPASAILAVLAVAMFGPPLLDYAIFLQALDDSFGYFGKRFRAIKQAHIDMKEQMASRG